MKRLNLKYHNISQVLDEDLENDQQSRPMAIEMIKKSERKAKHFLKTGRY
jgi:hypothetical protein